MKARKILYVLFTVLFAIVLTLTILYARRSYELNLQAPADDIFGHSFDLGIIALFTTPFILFEIEVFHVILYFISGERKMRPYKTAFNMIELLLSFGAIAAVYLGGFTPIPMQMWEFLMLASLFGYIVIKIVHAIALVVLKIQRKN